jgi:hypothetical protein
MMILLGIAILQIKERKTKRAGRIVEWLNW